MLVLGKCKAGYHPHHTRSHHVSNRRPWPLSWLWHRNPAEIGLTRSHWDRWYIMSISSWVSYITTWNPKHPLFNGCFSWMIPNLCIENCCFTKHPLKHGCLGFQVYVVLYTRVINLKYHLTVNSTIFPSLMQWFVGGKKTIPNKDFLFYLYRGVIYICILIHITYIIYI